MADGVELLQQLGFGEYEARAYVGLLQRSPLNGYELAKLSSLPRANVYGVLQKLEERGAVVRVAGAGGDRFAPVPPRELADRLGSRFEQTLGTARRALEEIEAPVEHEYVWNAQGYQNLLAAARAVIGEAERELLIAEWPQEAGALAGALAEAEARCVAITTLCLPACAQECGGCRGSIYRYRLAPEGGRRWLILVPDGQEVLTGEIGPGDEAIAARTRQPLLVELAAWYIRHTIALAGIVDDLGPNLPELLSPQTLQTLSSLGPSGLQGGWLAYLRQVLHGSPGGVRNLTTEDTENTEMKTGLNRRGAEDAENG